MAFWRSQTELEVDLVVGEVMALEIKSSEKVSSRDHKGLKAIAEEAPFQHPFLVSRDKVPMSFDSGIKHIYWEDFLNDLWQGKILHKP